jgi:hypothetical protein
VVAKHISGKSANSIHPRPSSALVATALFRIIATASVLALAVTLTGCQTNLTRARAKALIDPLMKPASMVGYGHQVLLQVVRYVACENESDYVESLVL